jgi:hypothetical protein
MISPAELPFQAKRSAIIADPLKKGCAISFAV